MASIARVISDGGGAPARRLRFAVCGAGFWAPYQLAGWRELGGAECVAVCDPAPGKAAALAVRCGVGAQFTCAREMLAAMGNGGLDFLEVISSPASHEELVLLAAEHGVPVVCQKPMATDLGAARRMVDACARAGVPFFVHENWRWQAPLRAVRVALDSGAVGEVFHARIQYANHFPVFDNQPALREASRFILMDMGVHILDVSRMLFGDAFSVYCRTGQVNPGIRGEDVATVVLGMSSGATVVCEMSYASRLARESFPETFVLVEGDRGSVELGPNHVLQVTTRAGTETTRHPPPAYDWADPAYALAQTSCVACNADILRALRGGGAAETSAADNLRSLGLVFAAYASADSGRAVGADEFTGGAGGEPAGATGRPSANES